VLKLRKENPDLFEQLAHGKVTLAEAQREMKKQHKEAIVEEIRLEPQPLPEGPFRVIVVDPPWRYDTCVETSGLTGLVEYADMSLEEICALPVGKLAHEDCVLWLWITNTFLAEGAGAACMKAWGFTPKTILTWDKVKLGTGHWIRNVTEHCILGVRGNPVVELSNQRTLISEPRREHSRKPERFYDLVDGLCPGSKVELFAREARPGWAAWGAEKEKFDGRRA
jgi:N6-adenosine-specific RNA methylase IME4